MHLSYSKAMLIKLLYGLSKAVSSAFPAAISGNSWVVNLDLHNTDIQSLSTNIQYFKRMFIQCTQTYFADFLLPNNIYFVSKIFSITFRLFFERNTFPVCLRNWLISAWLEPVLSHTEKIIYRFVLQFSANTKIKIINWYHFCFNLITFILLSAESSLWYDMIN